MKTNTERYLISNSTLVSIAPKRTSVNYAFSYRNCKDNISVELQKQYEEHIDNKTSARRIKDERKDDALKSATKTASAFDLEQNLIFIVSPWPKFFLFIQEKIRCVQPNYL